MSIQTRVAMVSIMLISSFAMAEGSADKVYGSMIQENEKRWREYALSIDKNPPETLMYALPLSVRKDVTTHDSSFPLSSVRVIYSAAFP